MSFKPVVFDVGTYMTRAGLAGDEAHNCRPTVVGRTSSHGCSDATGQGVYVGDEAEAQRNTLTLTRPLERGMVTNWRDIELVWKSAFDALGAKSEDSTVLMAEKPLTPKGDREKTTELLFEHFNVPSTYLATDAMLSLYSTGRTTGMLLDLGYEVTYATPIHDSMPLPYAVRKAYLGGRHITEYLMRLLNAATPSVRTESFDPMHDVKIVEDIKAKLCYVARRYGLELNEFQSPSGSQDYQLPDGRVIRVGTNGERFRCAEALFRRRLLRTLNRRPLKAKDADTQALAPHLRQDSASYLASLPSEVYERIVHHVQHEDQQPEIHQLLFEAIRTTDIDLRRDMYGAVVITGGGSMFPSIGQRMEREVRRLAPATMTTKFLTPVGRKDATWLGGSILASCSNFSKTVVSRAEYEESGASIVHQKCTT